mmetsp:Transcript_37446/g.105736  ORF Transcript_37446/g.105736 Transcript_37446/m.105736 type:complete len:210 (+) Transcript_37446:867-1496(+)
MNSSQSTGSTTLCTGTTPACCLMAPTPMSTPRSWVDSRPLSALRESPLQTLLAGCCSAADPRGSQTARPRRLAKPCSATSRRPGSCLPLRRRFSVAPRRATSPARPAMRLWLASGLPSSSPQAGESSSSATATLRPRAPRLCTWTEHLMSSMSATSRRWRWHDQRVTFSSSASTQTRKSLSAVGRFISPSWTSTSALSVCWPAGMSTRL